MAETSTSLAPGRSPKDERIAVRASREQRELIAQASRASATTVSDFVLRASITRSLARTNGPLLALTLNT